MPAIFSFPKNPLSIVFRYDKIIREKEHAELNKQYPISKNIGGKAVELEPATIFVLNLANNKKYLQWQICIQVVKSLTSRASVIGLIHSKGRLVNIKLTNQTTCDSIFKLNHSSETSARK